MIAELERSAGRRITKDSGLNSIALKGTDYPMPGADLYDMHVFSGLQPEVLGRNTCAGMKRGPEAADANAFAAELLGLFDLGANHEIQHQRANHGRDDL